MGLAIGDIVRPPSLTGVRTFSEVAHAFPDIRQFIPTEHYRDDRIYISRFREVGLNYARLHSLAFDMPGALYRVEPIGEVADDPEHPGFYSECESAEVTAVDASNAKPFNCPGLMVMARGINLRDLVREYHDTHPIICGNCGRYHRGCELNAAA
jgi:hypothetical protein